ncbi:sigma-70 family RNA polymerase sigma factor [Clostridium baratii]|uniref:sigma-70 family RNA polymerase sigma factor n=1 Tax=Clostridium baratii TaxID=1561 RepID=UPI0005F2C370|nr:sigma-70 family RNA polymerase sigma factor [Clostridium baratii]KJU71136.1 RNA polymerase sigma-70 factor [Clostridium baratii]
MAEINKDNYIKALREKNIEALDFIMDTYSNLIFKVAYKVLNKRELSEECINDVFLKVWNNIDRFNKEDDKFKNWICTITKYTAIDMLRREKKHSNNLSIEEEPLNSKSELEKDFQNDNDLLIIKNEINSMDKIDREIFIRRFYYGEKIRVISEKLGMTDNAINLRILRGRKRLSEKIREGKI